MQNPNEENGKSDPAFIEQASKVVEAINHAADFAAQQVVQVFIQAKLPEQSIPAFLDTVRAGVSVGLTARSEAERLLREKDTGGGIAIAHQLPPTKRPK